MKNLRNFTILLSISIGFLIQFDATAQSPVKVGSKLFTESVLLGEISVQLLTAKGFEVEFYDQLGGTQILWNALIEGDIDIYPDYTGTVIQEIIRVDVENIEELNNELRKFGIQATASLGFNNTYALGIKEEKTAKLNIRTISDLAYRTDLTYGFSNEFLDRKDGWNGLQQTYNLQPAKLTGLDHDLAYRGIEAGNIDVIDLYSTDAEIEYYNLKVLEDDKHYFPDYQAIFLYRMDLEDEIIDHIKSFENQISETEMIAMNASVKLDGISDKVVASEFLKQNMETVTTFAERTFWDRLLTNTLGHLYLVGISLGLAILFAIPLGVMAAKFKRIESIIIGLVGILQTIPSLALLVFMIPLLGIGSVPAMAALFLYSLLPIVRNTHAGIKNIPDSLMESAHALGLPNALILRKIELPLASSTILAGIKTSAVINVGTATLGALIGAGGYGQPILTGIRLDNTALILEGAIPAAMLALAVQALFDGIEKLISK